jgi:FtsH-binding integral membrane protein
MKLDDLKDAWKKEMTMKKNMTDFDRIRRDVDEFDRRAKVSWTLDLLACAGIITVVILAWLVWLPTEELNLLFHLGMLAMVIACVFVGGKIIRARWVSTTDDWTLSAKIDIQIEKREKEAKLLNTVAYWYLSPLLIAVILSSYGGYAQRTGSYIPNVDLWIYWAVCLVLYIGIYFFNRHQVKTKVQPILDQLCALRRELES